MREKILIVDDDAHIREVIVFALKREGMRVFEAINGELAVQEYQKHQPDLVVLDINLPEKDGLEVCKTIRKFSDVSILFLSSRDEEIDKIIGLEIGGDDYVTKPFSPRELVARIKVILKRAQKTTDAIESNNLLQKRGLLALEVQSHQVSWDSKLVELTGTEFMILKNMLKNPEFVYSRDQIMNLAYETNVYVSDRTIDSHIRHIRQKFADIGCETIFKTIHGVGYKLGSCD